MWRLLGVLCVIFLLGFVTPANAQTGPTDVDAEADTSAGHVLVGLVPIAPFIIQKENGGWTGLAVELWKEVARTLDITFTFREMSADRAHDALSWDEVDVVLGDFAVNSDHFRQFDFTRAYLHSDLAIASLETSPSVFEIITEQLLSDTVLSILGGLAVLLAVGGLGFWLIERNRNPNLFSEEHGKLTFLNGPIWAFLLVTAKECDVFKNASLPGRLFAICLLTIGITVSASYIALITSSITLHKIGKASYTVEDLDNLRLATLYDSNGLEYLEHQHLRYEAFDDLEKAMLALEALEVDAIVADRVVLAYHMRKHSEHPVALSHIRHRTQYFAFLMPKDSPLKGPINRTLLPFIESDVWSRLVTRMVGQDSL